MQTAGERHLSPGLGAGLYSQEALPRLGDRWVLTTTGPAPLAAIARLAGNALEAARFVFTFAIGAGARVATFIDVCMERKGKRTGLGTTWLVDRASVRHKSKQNGPVRASLTPD